MQWLDMMHTMQALEKTSQCFLCPVCTHRINISRSQCLHSEIKPSQRKRGEEHAPLRPPNPRLCFFKPTPPLQPVPRPLACLHPPTPPTPQLIHPPLATLGHESRLCMTARNIPCHKCFPKASTFVTLSADKTSPQPLMECASHFSECVNNFWLAGQTLHPGNVGCECVCATLCLVCLY